MKDYTETLKPGDTCEYREGICHAIVTVVGRRVEGDEVIMNLDVVEWKFPRGHKRTQIEVGFRQGYYGYAWKLDKLASAS